MAEAQKVSNAEFSIAYAGKDRTDDHTINVETLAPALMAFGKLMREANYQLNGKKSKAHVRVVSDFEHKCFNINFDVIFSFYDRLLIFAGTKEAQDAKNILEWIGLTGGIGFSLFKALKWMAGRKVVNKTEFVAADGQGMTTLILEDGQSADVESAVASLLDNLAVVKAANDALSPIGKEGFDKVEFRDGSELIDTINSEDVSAIRKTYASMAISMTVEEEPEPVESVAWLSVYSPVYDAAAPLWRFRMGIEVIYADISETDIAKNALELGGSLVDDLYYVKIEVTKDANGDSAKNTYKIIEVMDFVRAKPKLIQGDLLNE